ERERAHFCSLLFSELRSISLTSCACFVHAPGPRVTDHMAAFNKLPSGYWRVQVRRKHKYASRTFRLKSDAERWALEAEGGIATGKSIDAPQVDRRMTFGDLIRRHITDMAEVEKAPLRSKTKSLEKIQRSLGSIPLRDLTRERLIEYGKARA